MTDIDVLDRLDLLERDVRALQLRLDTIDLQADAPPRLFAEPEPAPPPASAPAPPPPPRAAAAPPTPRPAPPPRETPRLDIDLADLVGPRALAWAGGVVTLLGVVFLFVLAVDRGWVGPVERVAIGALASALVFGAGFVVRRRFGNLHAAVSAAGTGIAGGYATLLAAAALYDLVPAPVGLAIAAGIAALGTALALAWSSQTVAAFGLLGALAVPLAVALDGDLSVLGTAFAALVLAAAATVGLRKRWLGLVASAGALSLVEIGALVLQEAPDAPVRVVALAGCFWALYLGIGVARRLTTGGTIDALAATFVLGSGAFAAGAAALLIADTSAEGSAMLAAALVTGAVGAFLFRRDRDFGSLLAAVALAVGALAGADLLGGTTLAAVWAAEAAVLAWLAGRVRETRFAIAAVAYLLLSAGHVLAIDAPPEDLLERVADPAAGAIAVLGFAVGALLLGLLARRWPAADPEPERRSLGAVLHDFADARDLWSAGSLWAAGAAAVYAASLGLLEAFARLELAEPFAWGHVAVTGLWAAVPVGLLATALRLDSRHLRIGAFVAFAPVLLKLGSFDETLPDLQFGVAALVVAGAALAAALIERSASRWIAPALALLSAALTARGVVSVADATGLTTEGRGAALLAAAAVYIALGAAFLTGPRVRELATALWASGLVLGAAASVHLLDHTELVVAWAAASAVCALAAHRLREPRLQLASLALAVLALAETIGVLARPDELFRVSAAPANGVLALAASIGALLALGLLARVRRDEPDELDRALLNWQGPLRSWVLGSAAALALYAVSLAVLGAAVELGGADLASRFQRGHTVVSALWGLVGLVALTVGLRRGRAVLRRAGVLLFLAALTKLFVYDLSALSSMARAFSFLAVGGVLLLAGFVYQRLAADLDDRNGQPA